MLRAPEHEQALADARTFIGAVVYARYTDDPTRFARRRRPTADELKDPGIARHWELSKRAAIAAHKIQIKTCRHYAIWWRDAAGNYPAKKPERITDDWPYDHKDKIKETFGPFKDYSHDGAEFSVFKYCGVP